MLFALRIRFTDQRITKGHVGQVGRRQSVEHKVKDRVWMTLDCYQLEIQ